MTKNILLVGESWTSVATHFKGFDQFGSVTFHLGAEPFVKAVEGDEFAVTYMPAHEAATDLPLERDALDAWDAILISDIGANTILLHPDVWLHGKPVPNRLKNIRDWTRDGGGLMMIGGYLTFQGIDGRARWRGTPVEEALPVTCLPYDDRIEVPEGFAPQITQPRHPLVEGLGGDWPILLGANEVVAREGAEIVATMSAEEGGHPLLVAGTFGKGRTLAWTSDVGPHWLPQSFVDWDGYATLWLNCLRYLTADR